MRAGEADHTLHLCERFTECGISVDLLTNKRSSVRSKVSFEIHGYMEDWTWSELPKLTRFLKRRQPDAVFLYYTGWLYNYHPMITFVPRVSKSILPKSSFITQFGAPEGALPERSSLAGRVVRKGMSWWAGSQSVNWTFGTLLKDSDYVIVLSNHQRIVMRDHHPGLDDRLLLLPPSPGMFVSPENDGATRLEGRRRLNLQQSEFGILHYGYFAPGKGIETLFQAIQIISRQRNDFKLIMLGGDPANFQGFTRKLHDLARELGLADIIIWAGTYPPESSDGSIVFRAADLCVLPFDDGVTLNRSSVAAAACHGVPIVTTKGKFSEDAFSESEPVRLCVPKNPHALSEAITSVIVDSTLQQRLKSGSLHLAQKWFSWENTITRIVEKFGSEKVYREL
jgi:glycosyltransferase involved in cell wall biosynthesis